MWELTEAEWAERGTTNPRLRFFVERWHELLYHKTPITYRAHATNSHILLHEWREYLDHVSDGASSWAWDGACKIRDELLGTAGKGRPSIAGVIELDTSLNARFPGLIQEITAAGRALEGSADPQRWRAQRARAAADQLLAAIGESYLEFLFSDLTAALALEDEAPHATPEDCRVISRLTGAVVTQLLERGFSSHYLFSRRKCFTEPSSRRLAEEDDAGKWSAFVNRFGSVDKETTVVACVSSVPADLMRSFAIGEVRFSTEFRCRLDEASGPGDATEFIEEIYEPESAARRAEQHFQAKYATREGLLFASVVIRAGDHIAAIPAAEEKIHRALDLLRYAFKQEAMCLLNDVIVYWPIANAIPFSFTHARVSAISSIDPMDFGDMQNTFNRLQAHQHLDATAKDKLRAALRYCRLGLDIQTGENAFLCLWIALEFLTRMPGDESLSQAAFRFVSDIMGLQAIQRQLTYIATVLGSRGFRAIDGLRVERTDGKGWVSPGELYHILSDESASAALLRDCSECALAVHRITDLRQVLSTPQEMAKRMGASWQHANWQMHRMYRLRNEIVHSAAHAVASPLLHEHLHVYVDTLIRAAMVGAIKLPNADDLSDVFWRYSSAYQRIYTRLQRGQQSEDDVCVLVGTAPF